MGIALFSPDFPTMDAALRTLDDQTVETGTASISIEDRFVEFSGDFVPLYRMRTRLRIVCLHNGFEVHAFTGEVYLSSPDLLRLVSVEEEILPGARYAFLYDVSMDASVRASQPEARPGRLFFRKTFLHREETFPIHLHALSLVCAHFTTDRQLAKGQHLLLDIGEPAVRGALLEVEQALDFQQARSCYHCEILELDRPSRFALERHIDRLSQRNRLF